MKLLLALFFLFSIIFQSSLVFSDEETDFSSQEIESLSVTANTETEVADLSNENIAMSSTIPEDSTTEFHEDNKVIADTDNSAVESTIIVPDEEIAESTQSTSVNVEPEPIAETVMEATFTDSDSVEPEVKEQESPVEAKENTVLQYTCATSHIQSFIEKCKKSLNIFGKISRFFSSTFLKLKYYFCKPSPSSKISVVTREYFKYLALVSHATYLGSYAEISSFFDGHNIMFSELKEWPQNNSTDEGLALTFKSLVPFPDAPSNALVVSFRGSHSPLDFLHDAESLTFKVFTNSVGTTIGKAGSGFVQIYNYFRQMGLIDAIISEANQCCNGRIVITGHSLGNFVHEFSSLFFGNQ